MAAVTGVESSKGENETCPEVDGDNVSTFSRHVFNSELLQQTDIESESKPTCGGDRNLDNVLASTKERLHDDVVLDPDSGMTHRSVSLTRYLILALLFRIALLAFSVWQDETRWPDGQLRFTDVDYDVFSDAARALIQGRDIYEARPTYRYSPLIAAIVAPGFLFTNLFAKFSDLHWNLSTTVNSRSINRLTNQDPILVRIWGKLVFILADIVCAWLQFQVIRAESSIREPNYSGALIRIKQRVAVWLICFIWLFNPVTAIVSVRGNAEAVLGVCVLACLLLVIHRRALLAGLTFGLCVHLKLYPVIYAPAVYLWFTPFTALRSTASWKDRFRLLMPRWSHIRFGVGALISLIILTGLGYRFFGGWRFLHQAYLYHFTRVDIKHNFAPHFYPLYLLSGLEWRRSGLAEAGMFAGTSPIGHARALFDRLQSTVASLVSGPNGTIPSSTLLPSLSGLLRSLLENESYLRTMKHVFNFASMLPSIILIPFLAFRMHRSPGLCWFSTTFAFVMFNKVCTSQYFLWSLVILPIALAGLKTSSPTSTRFVIVQTIVIWFGSQGVWLATAYNLEMNTIYSSQAARSSWLLVWMASLLFFLCNVFLLRRLIRWYDISESVERDECANLEVKKDK